MIHRRRVKFVIRPPLYPQATTTGFFIIFIKGLIPSASEAHCGILLYTNIFKVASGRTTSVIGGSHFFLSKLGEGGNQDSEVFTIKPLSVFDFQALNLLLYPRFPYKCHFLKGHFMTFITF